MPAADLAHPPEIARHRRDRAQGGADHGFGHESDDVFAAERVDLCLELSSAPFAIGLRRFVGVTLAVFINRRNMMRLDQQRSKFFALPIAAPDRQRAERDAMIALPSCADVLALPLA